MIYTSGDWVIRNKINPDLLPEVDLSPAIKTLMYSRGMNTAEKISDFISPSLGHLRDPKTMKGIMPACTRIADAIENKETIGVFSDYDVDGVCSAALIHRFLSRTGAAPPVVFIPDRTKDGYGMNLRGIEELHDRKVSLLITADCGITSATEVDAAMNMGMDVIVTDHHEPDGTIPRALSVINPKQPGCGFSTEDLCGAGVIFHLIVALRATMRERGYTSLPNLKQDLDLVAVATIADVVSLDGINRILVKEGLNILNSPQPSGFSALAKTSGIYREIYSRDIGFVLGPRINAAGRVDSAMKAFELLVTGDEKKAYWAAKNLQEFNKQRQAIERKVLKEALDIILESPSNGNVIVVAGTDWHMGVIGIVASRIASRFSKPAIVLSISDGIAKGSGRSIDGIDLHSALLEVSDQLVGFGGHKMAVGLQIDPSKIKTFSDTLSNVIAGMKIIKKTRPEIDMKISPMDLTPALMDELEKLGPFGHGNPEPVFLIPSMEIVSRKKLPNSRVQLQFRHSGRIFHSQGFPMPPDAQPLPRFVDVAFTPLRKRINGRMYLYLDLKALSPV